MVLNYIALKIVVANLLMCHFKVARQTGWVLFRMIRASLCTHKHLLCPLRAESIKYILISSPKLKVVFFKWHSDRKTAISLSRAQSVQVIDIMSHARTLLKFGWNCGFVKYCTDPYKCHPNLKFSFQFLFLFFDDVSVGIKCVPTLKIDVLLNLSLYTQLYPEVRFCFQGFPL